MTNDQPIRFRTFADEDDNPWGGHAGTGAYRPSSEPTFQPEDTAFGATFPRSDEPARRGPGFLVWGTGLALVAGIAIAVTLLPKPGALSVGDPASAASLHVHRYVAPQPGNLANSALLPCFVNGVPAGSLTVADCGQRNGVVSGRLDVGLTQSQAATAVSSTVEQLAVPAAAPAPMSAPYRPALPRPQMFAQAQTRPAAPPDLAETPRRESYAAPPRSFADDDEDRAGDGRLDPEDSVRVAQTFYESLSNADGVRAASVVVPEKRRQGPLSAGAIDRFYSGLRAPLRLSRLYAVNDHTVVARYSFVDHDGGVCQGTARVTTTERDGEVYVQGVRALNGC